MLFFCFNLGILSPPFSSVRWKALKCCPEQLWETRGNLAFPIKPTGKNHGESPPSLGKFVPVYGAFGLRHPAGSPYLNDSEYEIALVEHDDFVFIGAIIHHVAKGKQGGRVGKDGTSPSRISLVSYDQILLMRCDCFIKNSRVIVFIRRSKMILNREVRTLSSGFFSA